MRTPIFNQCRTPIVVGQLYDQVQAPQDEREVCQSSKVVDQVEVVAVERIGDGKLFVLLRRSGRLFDETWLDSNYLRWPIVNNT